MKILFVLGTHNPSPGASWARIGYLAKDWSENNQVDILGSFSFKTLQKRGSKRIGRVTVSNFIFSVDLFNPFFFLLTTIQSFLVTFVFLIIKRPQIVLVSMPPEQVGLGASLACRLFRVKYVVDYRDEFEDHAIYLSKTKKEKFFFSFTKKLATLLYVKCPCVVTVTNPFKKALQERGVKNIRVIPNGADSNTFLLSTKRKTGHPFKLFYSGGVGGYYRLDIVVKALKLVVNRGYTDVVLVFAGTGTVDEVLSIAKKLGISKNIQYLGVINDQKKLAELISEADIGIIPYDDNLLWRDSLPAKFFEYCSCGLPVVSTSFDDSIISQLIKDNSIGLFSDPLNIELLAKNIIEFYTDETFRKKSAVNARQFIETQFDRRVLSKDYLDIICSLL